MHARVAVIGAGQAGLSAAHHLLRRGLGRDALVVCDANPGPGGAWRHRWPTLTLSTVNGVHDLPGMPFAEVLGAGQDPLSVPAAEAVPRYYSAYEEREGIAVRRPVRAHCVSDGGGGVGGAFRVEATGPDGPLVIHAAGLVNATGSWERPFIPHYPGAERFRGRQMHTKDYRGPEELAGRRVVVVGGGISAVDILTEVSAVADTLWVTRTPPRFSDEPFTPEVGRRAVARVEDRVRRGLPPGSVVSVTGIPWNPRYREAEERGALARRPMFTSITEDGVRWGGQQEEQRADVIVWATGFRSSLDHLAPLRLRGPGGGITMTGRLATQVQGRPRLHLVGYGPSASTIGANRAGRAVAAELLDALSVDTGGRGSGE
ncbi:NAD(P)/FAD-dependent oxidoreductase [Tomitella fengzijianii]|uniref:NAD(P)/FAD-dependent oxidoreductase n=2 Tax=Tomitella fengzijianii TaxID=2597660 RepID=A0A516X789_9ACTN|nr:NAD(P)/FAD-dependent oxidoreductase [Tomitella fengzijianii]QDQ98932.1 NAD(P)/FAD-dependent oxidoreductase [Tomitella fengzijianii]